ncbi:MAG: hypothetical protein AB8F78_05985 [Saprospiraceae bacterium]
MKQLDTIALYQYVEHYIDTSTSRALQLYKRNRPDEDSIAFTRFQLFETMCSIPGSSDLLVQADVMYRPEAEGLFPWGVVQMMLRVDTALNLVSVRELVQDWRPSIGDKVDSVIFKRLVGMTSESHLIFYEPGEDRTDTLLRSYSLMGERYVPDNMLTSQESLQEGADVRFGNQVSYSFYNGSSIPKDSFFLSTPSGKTVKIDKLHADGLSGHRYFDIEPVKGTENVVLLTGKPDERGYVGSKILSLYNASTKKLVLLGTYMHASTKAHDVSVLDGAAYILLYDDRRNRPLLHRVDLSARKAFQM